MAPRWKRCSEGVDDDLGEALGQAYAAKYFGPDAKQQALEMVKEIETAMQQDIDGLPWMSRATKQQALIKLHGVANKIGYPDKWRDYSKLEIIRGDELATSTARALSNSTASSRKSASPSIAASGT